MGEDATALARYDASLFTTSLRCVLHEKDFISQDDPSKSQEYGNVLTIRWSRFVLEFPFVVAAPVMFFSR